MVMRTMRTAALALLILAFPSASSALTLTREDGTTYGPDHRLSRAVAAMKVQAPNATVRLYRGDCPAWQSESYACATSEGGLPVIYLPAFRYTAGHRVFYHEIGHHFDRLEMSQYSRDRFSRLMGRGAFGWTAIDERGRSSMEVFADLYSACAQDGERPIQAYGPASAPIAVVHGQYGLHLPKSKYVRACRLLRYEALS